MKKIFTLIIGVACAIAINAQEFTCTVDGKPVENGATVTVGYEYGHEGSPFWKSVPEIYLTASEDISCSIKTSCAAGTKVKFCKEICLEPVREGDFDVVEYDFDLTAGEAEKLDVEYSDFMAADQNVVPAKSSVDVIVSVRLKPRFTFTLVFDGNVAGIDNVAGDGSYVNLVAGNILEYNVANGTKLDIYSLNGATVIERTVNGHGSLSLDRLAPGVYLYKAGELTGKVLVK